MARIPVEHDRKGSPWWLWLVGLLLVAGLIWLLAGLFDPDEPAEMAEGVETVEPIEPVAGPVIIDPIEIREATEPASLVGREVQLENMRVVSVPQDTIFVVEKMMMGADTTAIGTTPTGEAGDTTTMAGEMDMSNRILVVLHEDAPTPPDSVEGGVDVSPGQMVQVFGEVRELNDEILQSWNMPEINVQEIAQNGLYVYASQVNVTERATDSQ